MLSEMGALSFFLGLGRFLRATRYSVSMRLVAIWSRKLVFYLYDFSNQGVDSKSEIYREEEDYMSNSQEDP
jgi:hypothetical protein